MISLCLTTISQQSLIQLNHFPLRANGSEISHSKLLQVSDRAEARLKALTDQFHLICYHSSGEPITHDCRLTSL